MREILFFAIIATLAGTTFVVAALELILTVRRRKATEVVKSQVFEMKKTYSETLTKATEESQQKLEEVRHEVDSIKAKAEAEKTALEHTFEEKLEDAVAETEKELAAARAKAKRLQAEAKLQADEYMAKRQDEVEENLMNLVLDVTKRVLPQTLTYELQKEIVLEALREVKVPHA